MLVFLLGALVGCRDTMIDLPYTGRQITVEIPVVSSDAEHFTRSTDENTIADINFYLFGQSNAFSKHLYTTDMPLRFECPEGDYVIYVVANQHRDLGDLSASQLDACTVAHRDSYAALPMAARIEIPIRLSAGSVLLLPAIELHRQVAKVAYRIAVSQQAANIRLLSVQACNLPRRTALFGEAGPLADKTECTAGPRLPVPETSTSYFSGEHYQFANPQGTNPSITDQRQKDRDHAPEHASYLLIRARRGEKILAYRVYLGENNTDNFDVRRNTVHRLRITLLGDEEIDTRVSSYVVRVWDDVEQESFGGYCIQESSRTLHIEVEGARNDLALHARIEVKQGDGTSLGLDRQVVNDFREFELYDPDGTNDYELDYNPDLFDPESATLAYTVTVYDDGGFSQSFDFEHRYANALYGYIHDRTAATRDRGTIEVRGALHTQALAAASNDRLILTDAAGCTLTAVPKAGYRFDGWFADAKHTRLLASDAEYAYRPQRTSAFLFARFIPDGYTPLDADGTANSYIAPKLQTGYSFDARTMGNGRATPGITPHSLAGHEARVLWESGTKAGAVVGRVAFEEGRIRFTTGTDHGNALIGLFDKQGRCIWSWHIWAVDYDPAASAQTYASGAVFMDRNLGALTADCTEPASCGLVYQWGRKDPFLHVGEFASGAAPGPAVYGAGFRYDAISPAAETSDVQELMTVAWSVAHPTTFMEAASFPPGSDEPDIADWLYTPQPHLWGNTTTGGQAGIKTIYDPCPPGWRVPDADDFAGIERAGVHAPHYVEVSCDASHRTRYPLGGSFNGNWFSDAGRVDRVHTNTPYLWDFSGGAVGYDGLTCTAICFSTSTVPPYISSTRNFRYTAEAIRCVRE